MGKVIVKCSRTEFAAGLLYTGCSRVKDQKDLAIEAYDKSSFPTLQK